MIKWNALNILIQNASTVGALDLKIYGDKQTTLNFSMISKIKNLKYYIY